MIGAVLEQVLQVGFFAAILRIATPLLLATLGEMVSERSGVLNLGIEGIMLLSAMTGFTAAYFSGNPWIGVAAALATGGVLGLVHGFFTVLLGLSQQPHALLRLVAGRRRSIHQPLELRAVIM